MDGTRFLETPIRHASDVIFWYDASGYVDVNYRPAVGTVLDVTLATAPNDIRMIHALGRTSLVRKNLAGSHVVVDGRATSAQMQAPTETPYPIIGSVSDPERTYNPRQFSISAGNVAGNAIAVYRSPLGTQLREAGGLRGSVVYENGDAASWALIDVTVTPSLGGPVNFIAQADIHGDFVLPLTRLPALTRNAPSTTYNATLSIRADGVSGTAISDPDATVAHQSESFDTADSFLSAVNFAVQPGTVATLTSMGSMGIVIRPS